MWRRKEEVSEEIREHIAEAIDALMSEGMSRAEAELEAKRRFGNPTLLEERSHDVWRWTLFEQFAADLRYALRQLRRAPAFAVASIVTLALGIGANTAVFSVVNAVILRPLPFNEPERLMTVQSLNLKGASRPEALSYPTFFDFRDRNRVFDRLVCYRATSLSLSGRGESVSLRAEIVSHDLFEALGVQPTLGRGFLREEEESGHKVVVLSHQLWVDRFGSDRSVIGQSMTLGRKMFTIVGVAPRDFNFPIGGRRVQIWTTPAVEADSETSTPMTKQRSARVLNAMGRLKPGVTRERAQPEMDALAAAIAEEHKDQNKSIRGTIVRPAIETIVGDGRGALLILLGAVGLVLLIACANVANLLLARTTERRCEFAVRASIGASRGRIVRQVLAESLTFGIAGSIAGILLAKLSIGVILPLAGSSLPRIEQTTIDGRVLGFSVALACLTSVIFSLAPAMRLGRIELAGSLKEGSRGAAGGRDRLRSVLVAAQVAIGLALLSGAGALADGFVRLLNRDIGFDPHGLVSFSAELPGSIVSGNKHLAVYDRLLEKLSGLPGVVSVAAAMPKPLAGHEITVGFNLESRPSLPHERPFSDMAYVTPSYFATMGARILEGRGFTERDTLQSPLVLVVNQAFAEKFFPGESAVGKLITPGATVNGAKGMREIVGVVSNLRQDPVGKAADPIYYFAFKQLPWCCPGFLVRTAGSSVALESSIRQVVASVDDDYPVYGVQAMDQMLSRAVAGPRFQTALTATFALIALTLMAVGIYGILAYSVLRRTREIGVRIALGGARSSVVTLILREALTLVGFGMAVGLVGAFGASGLVRRSIIGESAPQSLLVAVACAVIALAAVAAAYLPARRAASIDPMQALRMD